MKVRNNNKHDDDNAAFSSQGFDLDAAAGSDDGDVVYEIGGGASRLEPPLPTNTMTPTTTTSAAEKNDNAKQQQEEEHSPKEEEDKDGVMAEADEYKQQGNEAFQRGDWQDAYDCYTRAMEATPGLTGAELLKLRDAWRDEQRRQARERLRREQEAEDARRRRRREKELQRQEQKKQSADGQDKTDKDDEPDSEEEDNDDETKDTKDDSEKEQKEQECFVAPPHVHGTKLAVFYGNRAATLLHLERYQEAVADCDVALLWNPVYTKAFLRRATAHERLDQTELALEDVKQALATTPAGSPSAPQIQKQVAWLQKLEDERMEKLKAETMDKLKDLGNSLLGSFGLSLDNFQAVQDPKTGSYSISFNQNTSK